MQDTRTGYPLTSASTDAVECYLGAIDLVLGSESGALDKLDQALALDPDFTLALAARYLLARDGNDPESQGYKERALSSASDALPQEQQHLEVLCGLIEAPLANLEATQSYLLHYPADLLVISQLCGYLIFYGGPNKLTRVLEVLEAADPRLQDDWAYLARLGFAASEAGDQQRGRELVQRALQLRPEALYTIHSFAHILHDEGKPQESVELIRSWLEVHQERAKGGNMYGHVQWHLALSEWQLGQGDAAWQRYREYAAPTTTTCGPVLTLADCGGFLLRDYLRSGATQPQSGELRALTERFDNMLTHPFIALHVAGIHAASGNSEGLAACRERIANAEASANRELALTLVAAIGEYAAKEYRAAAQRLATIDSDQRIGIGGSYVERTLIDLLEARARALAG